MRNVIGDLELGTESTEHPVRPAPRSEPEASVVDELDVWCEDCVERVRIGRTQQCGNRPCRRRAAGAFGAVGEESIALVRRAIPASRSP
jgi:hypothetical protein